MRSFAARSSELILKLIHHSFLRPFVSAPGVCPAFAGWRQHDSQELLLAVLSRLDVEEKWLVTQGKTPTNAVNDFFRGEATTFLRTVTSARLKQSTSNFTGCISICIPSESLNASYMAPGVSGYGSFKHTH